MKNLIVILICISCIFIFGCQKNEDKLNSNSNFNDENISGDLNIDKDNAYISGEEIESKEENKIYVEKLKLNRDDGVFSALVYDGEILCNGVEHTIKITTEDDSLPVAGNYDPTCEVYIDNGNMEVNGLMEFYVFDIDKNDNDFEFATYNSGGAFYHYYDFYEYENNTISYVGTRFCFDDDDDIEKIKLDEDNRFFKRYCNLFEEEFMVSYFTIENNSLVKKYMGIDFDIDSNQIFTIAKDTVIEKDLVGNKVQILDVSWTTDDTYILVKVKKENGEIAEIDYRFDW